MLYGFYCIVFMSLRNIQRATTDLQAQKSLLKHYKYQIRKVFQKVFCLFVACLMFHSSDAQKCYVLLAKCIPFKHDLKKFYIWNLLISKYTLLIIRYEVQIYNMKYEYKNSLPLDVVEKYYLLTHHLLLRNKETWTSINDNWHSSHSNFLEWKIGKSLSWV